MCYFPVPPAGWAWKYTFNSNLEKECTQPASFPFPFLNLLCGGDPSPLCLVFQPKSAS